MKISQLNPKWIVGNVETSRLEKNRETNKSILGMTIKTPLIKTKE